MGLQTLLAYGIPGLCTIQLWFCYKLLKQHQTQSASATTKYKLLIVFMTVSTISIIVGLASAIIENKKTPIQTIKSENIMDASLYNATWSIQSGADVDYLDFTRRYTYAGNLTSSTKDGNITFDGDITTYDLYTKAEVGTAHFIATGIINNNYAATYYTYKKIGVDGFGTCLVEFDHGGYATMHLTFRITRKGKESTNIGQATFKVKRIN